MRLRKNTILSLSSYRFSGDEVRCVRWRSYQQHHYHLYSHFRMKMYAIQSFSSYLFPCGLESANWISFLAVHSCFDFVSNFIWLWCLFACFCFVIFCLFVVFLIFFVFVFFCIFEKQKIGSKYLNFSFWLLFASLFSFCFITINE